MTIKSLTVRIGADVSEFETKVGAAEKKFQTMTSGMEKAGRGLTAAVTLPLIGIGAASIKMAMDAVESENLFDVAMGSMGDSARAFSVGLRDQFGLNEYEVRKSIGTFYQMTSSMGLTRDEAYKVSTGFTQLSYDMASFFNLKPEEAFDKLRAGIAGETEPLRKLGIVVDENTVKTYAYKNGIAAQGAELTTGEKVLARYGAIMEQTKNAQGDLGRTLDSPTNKMRIMKDQVKALSVDIGMALMPAYQALLSILKPIVNGLQGAVKAFTGLPGPVKAIVIIFGGLAAAAGPTLMILSRMIPVIQAVGGASKLLAIGLNALPFVAVAVAAGIFITKLMEVQAAEDAAEKASARCAETEGKLWDKLSMAAAQAGITGKAWEDLTNKYGMNAAALAMAIQKGNEGVEIQAALAKIGKEHADAIDKVKAAQEAASQAEQNRTAAQQKAKQVSQEVINLEKQLAQEVVTSSMTEYQKAVYNLDQQTAARRAWITSEVAGVTQRNTMLQQLDASYNAQKLALDTQYQTQALANQTMFSNIWIAGATLMRTMDLANQEAYNTAKTELQNEVNLIGLSGLDYQCALIEQERVAKLAALDDEKLYTAAQKAELATLINKFYDDKLQKATEGEQKIYDATKAFTDLGKQLIEGFTIDALDAFYKWGEGSKGIIEGLGGVISNWSRKAIQDVASLSLQYGLMSKKDLAASQATGIAAVIKSVMMAIPFPFNLIVVGGAIAAVSALFHAIKLGEGGVVTRPTNALIGERGPEAVVPLRKYGLMPALAGAGASVTVNAHFYGNIGSQVDVDQIGKTLGDRVSRAIQAGRSY